MNITEAIAVLKSFGWNAYLRDDSWVVYDSEGYNGLYNNGQLIHLANSCRTHKWRCSTSGKTQIGPGGKWCTCCTRSIPAVLKKWDRRAVRRNGKKLLVDDDED